MHSADIHFSKFLDMIRPLWSDMRACAAWAYVWCIRGQRASAHDGAGGPASRRAEAGLAARPLNWLDPEIVPIVPPRRLSLDRSTVWKTLL